MTIDEAIENLKYDIEIDMYIHEQHRATAVTVAESEVGMTASEAIREKRKFAIELKQLVHQKCVEINHYVSGCDSPFSYMQIADVQESLREIENTLNIKVKE